MKKTKYNVAVIGATGLVGKSLISTLEKRNFPIGEVRLFASLKSEGKSIFAFNRNLKTERLENNLFANVDFAFFCVKNDVSLKYAPLFAKQGAITIDNSSAFRFNEKTPLIIPEINGEKALLSTEKIIANPNCSTIIALTPLKNVFKKYHIKRLIFSTYQAVSGSGYRGIQDLLLTRNGFCGKYYSHDISSTFIPKIGEEKYHGQTEEEWKMINETRKILNSPLPVSATCVRVPVENCHGVNVEVECSEHVDLNIIKKEMEFESAKHVDVPTALDANGKDYVVFGRVRQSGVFTNGFSYFAVGDNLQKGAALNAVQIAETYIK